MNTNKTPEEARNLINDVVARLLELPDEDDYGYPTDEEKSEMLSIIDGLLEYIIEGASRDEAVQSWAEGEDLYYLSDYQQD